MAYKTSGPSASKRVKPPVRPPGFASLFLGQLRSAGPKPQTHPPAIKGKTSVPKAHPVKPPAKLTTASKPHAGAPTHHAPPLPVRSTPVHMSRPGRPVPQRSVRPARASAPPAAAGPVIDPEQAYIDAATNPQLEALDRQEQFRQQQQQSDLDKFNAFTQQYLGVLNAEPAAVQKDYERGIAQRAVLAQLSSNALAAANPNAQTQADLAAIGAPAAQQQQVADQNQQVFAGGAANLLFGGTIPATQMSEDEAARLAFARALPGIAKTSGDQALRDYLRKQAEGSFDISNRRADVLAQIPKLRLDYQGQQASNAAKQEQLRLERIALRVRAQGQAFNQNATTTRLNQSDRYRYAEVFGYDPKTGQPTLAAIKAANKDKAKSKKPPSATSLKNWNTFGENAYYGVAPKTRYNTDSGKFENVPGTGKAPITYYSALKRLMGQGATLTQAQKILGAYYRKGEGGRPYVSLQGRLALEKAGMPLPHANAVPDERQKKYLQQHGLG